MRSAALLSEALSLWHGPALGDVMLEACQAPAARLEEGRLTALEQRIDLDLLLGQNEGLIAELRSHVQACPLRERLWAQLMLALYRAGRQAEALAVYRELRSTLVGELGVEPTGVLQRLHHAILSGADALKVYRRDRPGLPLRPDQQRPPDPQSAPAPAPAPARERTAGPAQLPAGVAAFTGRGRQLKLLDDLLSASDEDYATAVPIAVISGTAGVGKTALAVHWAHRIRDRFSDGQLYVNLRGYAPTPPMRPIDALGGFLPSLGVAAEQVPAEPEHAAALFRTLMADRRMLVVLDNAHSVDQVRPLLPASPGCLVLVTSRDTLGGLIARDGARHLTLDVLSQDEAEALLARVLGPERTHAEPEATGRLARLCALLPLALRIAAANLTFDPDRGIADHVAALSTGDRLGSLEVGADEQSAVRAAFALSYVGLTPAARRLFRLLGLAPGPDITAAAAGALAGLEPDVAARLLDRLAGSHLLGRTTPDRFTFHDLLRLYANERADDEETAADRDAAVSRLYGWYLATADSAARLVYPGKVRLPLQAPLPTALAAAAPASLPASQRPSMFDSRQQAMEWLDAELPNLLAAVEYAAGPGPYPTAWLLADVLRGYFWLRMDTVAWLSVAHAGLRAATAAGSELGQAAAHLSLADVRRCQGRYEQAIEHYAEAATLSERAGWPEGQAGALGNLGSAYFWLGRLNEAADRYAEALEMARREGRLSAQAIRLGNLGLVYWLLGRLEDAADHQRQALAIHRQLGERGDEAVDLANLGECYHALGRLELALGCLTEALTLHREAGDQVTAVETLRVLAAIHSDAGRYSEALDLVRTALELARDSGERPTEANALNTLATVYGRLGRHRQAIDHHQRALELAQETGTHFAELVALVGLGETHLRLTRTEEALAYARQAVTLAGKGGFRVIEGQAHTVLAAAYLARARPDLALEHARAALELHRRTGYRLGEARTLVLLGTALNDEDENAAAEHWQRALDLFTDIGAAEAKADRRPPA
jgi:tetratricopeptide (TPR) repeat protein